MTKQENFWDDEDFKSDDMVRFEKEGDHYSGKVLSLSKVTGMNNAVIPRLVIESSLDQVARVLLAGATILKSELQTAAPQVGDTVHIVLDSIDPAQGARNGLKRFSVSVDRTS
jgi:hypothetical protein